jgi:hypothetical protein
MCSRKAQRERSRVSRLSKGMRRGGSRCAASSLRISTLLGLGERQDVVVARNRHLVCTGKENVCMMHLAIVGQRCWDSVARCMRGRERKQKEESLVRRGRYFKINFQLHFPLSEVPPAHFRRPAFTKIGTVTQTLYPCHAYLAASDKLQRPLSRLYSVDCSPFSCYLGNFFAVLG